ncbi:hypothetical protein EV196_11157 [Mariniflexile fucanivorans]|uniref:Uncharacterized protein n=1 Tax=Mariniflexile fucanivorans TaxID=264023 RepID=A0A4R1RAT1_9FLAO|nr:hypothetical protein [Mariniflexile fucanivorans]TCL62861.1 hypothetical protein EV196_11157 [Mariniflexile fucanivorans]
MNTSSILEVWDYCVGKNQTIKGAALASLVLNEANHSNIFNWSIEKRDVALFHVRKMLFGNRFNNIAHCPKCKQAVEWDFYFHQMEIPILIDTPDNIEIPIDIPNYHIMVRLPNSDDLICKEEIQIIRKCILNLKDFPEGTFNQKIPDDLLMQINNKFNKTCKASNISYHLNCTECKHEWDVVFDISTYLWKEIDQWAKSFLRQICLLAKAFGWSELDIINMSENRRNHYLNLLNS